MALSKIQTQQFLSIMVEKAKPYIQDAKNYWIRLSEREQLIVKVGVIGLILMFLFIFVSSMLNLEQGLKDSIQTKNIDLANAKILNLEMQDLSSITANEFTEVSVDKVRGDITQLFSVKDPDVAINDDMLIINLSNVKFKRVVLFLDQMRKSYGEFPDKLKIYRTGQAGLVNFYATFHVEK